MLNATLTITLVLEGPIISKSTSIGGFGVDAVMSRTNGAYCIPGSLVKGKLRQAWDELKSMETHPFEADINKWLGNGSSGENNDNAETAKTGAPDTSKTKSSADSNLPKRGLLNFSDFLHDRPGGSATICRISIDPESGAVKNRHLQVIEAPFAAGETVCFIGTVRFSAEDARTADNICWYVETGLRWITSIGGARTVGFGRLVNVCAERKYKELEIPPETASVSDSPAFAVIPQGPFCVARRRISKNLFESETVIPGGVIKGALASMWGSLLNKGPNETISEGFDPARPELSRCFSSLRFQHAFPARAGQTSRPVVPPLSLVKTGKSNGFYDVTDFDCPVLIDGKAPQFDIDWKDRGNIDSEFGWPDLKRELRVHNSIAREYRKVEKEKLFAYETILPGDNQWCFSVDLGKIDEKDRPAVTRQLFGLLSGGLNGWGKTKVNALVIREIAPRPLHIPSQDNAGRYIVTLQTAALLCDPDELNESSGEDELCRAYQAVWKELSEDSLEMVEKRYFARQSLAGGGYLYNRFGKGGAYRPFLLTDAGSVFVLHASDPEKGAEKIAQWLRHGLPLPGWVKKRYGSGVKAGELWSVCPYLPENGYGEIAVNLETHSRRKPENFEEVRDVI